MKNLPLLLGGLAVGGYLLFKNRTQSGTPPQSTQPIQPDPTNVENNPEAPNDYMQETRQMLEEVIDEVDNFGMALQDKATIDYVDNSISSIETLNPNYLFLD